MVTPQVIQEWLTSLPGDSRVNRSQSQVDDAERTTNATCGPRPSKPFASYDPDLHSWRTSQAYLTPVTLDESSETWPKRGTMRDGLCWRLLMLGLRTGGKGSGLWRSPAQQEPGVSAERLEPIEGGTPGGMNRHFDKRTGRMAQIGLSQQIVLRGMWPTPRTGKTTDEKSESWLARNAKGDVSTPPLSLAVKWPTPQERDGKGVSQRFHLGDTHGCLPNAVLGGTKTRRTFPTPQTMDALTKIRPVTYRGNSPRITSNRGIEGQAGLRDVAGGQLNPDWVEWLMGWPIGWTALEPLATGRFQSWLQLHSGFSQGK